MFRIRQIAAGNYHALARSQDKGVWFWGTTYRVKTSTKPVRISSDLGDVVDMATTRGCKFSAFKTNSAIYFWGECCHRTVGMSRATGFATMEEVFVAADPPVLFKTVEFGGHGQRVSDTMIAAFNDKVRFECTAMIQFF